MTKVFYRKPVSRAFVIFFDGVTHFAVCMFSRNPFSKILREKNVCSQQTAVDGAAPKGTILKVNSTLSKSESIIVNEMPRGPNSFVTGNGWLAVKSAMGVLKDCVPGAFVPIKVTLVGVLAIMDHVEVHFRLISVRGLCLIGEPESYWGPG